MRVRYLKDHHPFLAGEETDSDNANFLIRYKIAEEVQEKAEIELIKEKAENTTDNVPTAKKKKK